MEFNNNTPIYIQIYDWLCEELLNDSLLENGRLKSVRELGADIGVNPNTIMRTYEKLTNDNIIYNKRGIGYFFYEDAKTKILSEQREQFINEEVPRILKKMELLGLNIEIFKDGKF